MLIKLSLHPKAKAQLSEKELTMIPPYPIRTETQLLDLEFIHLHHCILN